MLSRAGTPCYYSTLCPLSLTQSCEKEGANYSFKRITQNPKCQKAEQFILDFLFHPLYLLYLLCDCEVIKWPPMGPPLTFVGTGQECKCSCPPSTWLGLFSSYPRPIPPTRRSLWDMGMDVHHLKLHLLEALGRLGKEFSGFKNPVPRIWF